MTTEEMVFLRTFDAVAACLRGFKQMSLDATSRGDAFVEMTVDQMWTAAFESVCEAAQKPRIPVPYRGVADGLLKRLGLWQHLARQTWDTKEPEVKLREHVAVIDTRAIWEASDDLALSEWEELRAKLIGLRSLPFEGEAAS